MKTNWKTGIAAAVLALLSNASSALGLMDSYAKALEADPTLRAADQAVLAGREQAVQGRALLLPRVTLSAGVTQLRDESSTSLPPALAELYKPESTGGVRQAALHLKQPIVDAKARADRTQLQQRTELAEVAWRDAQQDLLQRVAEAYFDLLLAQESLRTVQAEKAAVALQRDRAQARYDVGRGKITDLQEAQARLDGVAAKEVSARSTLELREAQYRELTGVAAAALAPIAPQFVPTLPQPATLAAWQQRGEELNARVQSRQHELAIASAEVAKYRLSSRPTLDLVASYSYKAQSGGLSASVAPDSNRSAMLGLQLNVPLYTGGALNSRERESIAKRAQAEEELAAARRDARLRVQDGWSAVANGVARVAALEQSLRSTRTALEATTLGRDVGTRTELDVLDAQQRVYGAQLELAQARHDYVLGRVRLASAAGALAQADLEALDELLVK